LIGLCLLQAGLVPEAMHHRAYGHHACEASPSPAAPATAQHLSAGASDEHDPHHCAICQAIKAYRFCWVGFEDSATSSLAPAIAPNRLSVARFHASALAISAPRAPPVWSPTPA
jgi:hypothetical protein